MYKPGRWFSTTPSSQWVCFECSKTFNNHFYRLKKVMRAEQAAAYECATEKLLFVLRILRTTDTSNILYKCKIRYQSTLFLLASRNQVVCCLCGYWTNLLRLLLVVSGAWELSTKNFDVLVIGRNIEMTARLITMILVPTQKPCYWYSCAHVCTDIFTSLNEFPTRKHKNKIVALWH